MFVNPCSLFVHYQRALRAANFGTNLFNAAGTTGDTSWAHLGVILGVILEVPKIESSMFKHIVVVFFITEKKTTINLIRTKCYF